MAWAGAAATSAVRVVEKPVLFILLFLIAIAACRAREGYTLVYSPVGVRIK